MTLEHMLLGHGEGISLIDLRIQEYRGQLGMVGRHLILQRKDRDDSSQQVTNVYCDGSMENATAGVALSTAAVAWTDIHCVISPSRAPSVG